MTRGFVGKRALFVGTILATSLLGPTSASARPALLDVSLTINQADTVTGSSTLFTPRLGIQIPVEDAIYIGFNWGITTGSLPVSIDDRPPSREKQNFGLLNPSVGVRYAVYLPDQVDFVIGSTLVFPVADANDVGQASLYQFAMAGVGAWEPWAFQPNSFAVTVPMLVRLDLQFFRMALDGSFFLLVPTEDLDQRRVQFGGQAALEVVAPIEILDLGLRAHAVQVGATGTTEAFQQFSLVPLLRVFLFQEQLMLETRLHLNLGTSPTTPIGESGIWGVTVAAGFRFEV